MQQAPPHSTYKRTVVNSYTSDSISERIQRWKEFLDVDIPAKKFSAAVLSSSPGNNNNNEDGGSSGESENILTQTARNPAAPSSEIRRSATDCVLTYSGLALGPLKASLKLESENLPSTCSFAVVGGGGGDTNTPSSSSSSSSSPSASPNVPIVSLTSKLLELADFQQQQQKTKQQSQLLFDAPALVARAVKCVQYAHMARLVHGRVCTDAFFVSSVVSPWIPTTCLGELPLLPQFFVNLGSELAKQSQAKQEQQQSSAKCLAQQHVQSACWWKMLAPELLRKEPYDGSADVWGIGVLAMQLGLAAAGYPFERWSNLKTADIADATIMSPHLSGLPPPAMSFVTMCLKRNPQDRPTLAGLVKHPWLKLTDGAQREQELRLGELLTMSKKNAKNNNAKAQQQQEETTVACATASDVVAAAPVITATHSSSSSSSSSVFRGELDASKVNEVLSALAQARKKVIRTEINEDDVSSSSGDDDTDDDGFENDGSDVGNSKNGDDTEDDDEGDMSTSDEDVDVVEDDDEKDHPDRDSDDD